MAGSKSDYFEKVLLDLVFGASTWTPPATLYIALSTAAYSDAATGTSMTEVPATVNSASSAYARQAVTNNTTNWPGAITGSPTAKSNGTAITFPAAAQAWGTVASFYVCDAAAGGNILYGGDLSVPKAIQQGDTATFATSSITITED